MDNITLTIIVSNMNNVRFPLHLLTVKIKVLGLGLEC